MKTIVAILAILFPLALCLEVEPGAFIKESPVAFIAIRAGVAVFFSAVALYIFSKGELSLGFKHLRLELSLIKEAVSAVSGIKSKVYALVTALKDCSLALWQLTFFLGTQIMTSFYISDWCKFGF